MRLVAEASVHSSRLRYARPSSTVWAAAMLRDIAEGVAGLIGSLLGLAAIVLSLAFGSGIVREHCLDVEGLRDVRGSQRGYQVDVHPLAAPSLCVA